MLVLGIIGPQVVRLLLLGLCSDAPCPPLLRSFLRGGGVYTQATAFGRLTFEEQIVIEISIRQNTPVRK